MAKTKKVVKKASPAKKTVVTKKVKKKTIATNSKKKTVVQKKAVKPKTVVKSKAITKAKAKTAPAKKAPVKKAPIKKVLVKKASVKKTVPAKKIVTKKIIAKKIVAKAKTAPAKKATVKKAPVKKVIVKKTPAKKVIAVKKPAVKKVVAKKIVTNAKPVQKPIIAKKQETKLVVKTIKKAQIPIKKMSVNPKDATIKDRSKYSDSELLEFKKIILDKLETARKDLEMLTEAFTNTGGNSTDDTSPTFKVLEEGSQVLSKEENSQLAARLNKFIQNLEAALVRIENKTYGICRVTGKLIPKERLRSVPHATLSIEAKEGR